MSATIEYLKKTWEIVETGSGYSYQKIRPQIVCKDGFAMSVQGSDGHCCTPRTNGYYYSHVEVGYPSEEEILLMEYAKGASSPTQTVYGWVPVEIVDKIIEKHGGIKCAA